MSETSTPWRFETAYEMGVEESPNLWRVTYWAEIPGWARLRCTKYFGDQQSYQDFVGRNQGDVISVREYHLHCEGEA